MQRPDAGNKVVCPGNTKTVIESIWFEELRGRAGMYQTHVGLGGQDKARIGVSGF